MEVAERNNKKAHLLGSIPKIGKTNQSQFRGIFTSQDCGFQIESNQSSALFACIFVKIRHCYFERVDQSHTMHFTIYTLLLLDKTIVDCWVGWGGDGVDETHSWLSSHRFSGKDPHQNALKPILHYGEKLCNPIKDAVNPPN